MNFAHGIIALFYQNYQSDLKLGRKQRIKMIFLYESVTEIYYRRDFNIYSKFDNI